MEYIEFHKRFGGSARSNYIEGKGYEGRRVLLPRISKLPYDFIRLDVWEIEYLFRIAQQCKIGILEIGRAWGGSCFMMACAAPNIPIHSIDINGRSDIDLWKHFERNKIDTTQINIIVGDSAKKYPEIGEVDLLFVDGDHEYEGCRNDLFTWYDKITIGGSIIMHDCHLPGVHQAAVEFLTEHPEFKTILSPHIPNDFWNVLTGSLGHFIKLN